MPGRQLLATLGVGAFAVVCCAGLPAALALVSGVTIIGLLGGAVGLVLLAGCGTALAVRARRLRACAAPRSPRKADA